MKTMKGPGLFLAQFAGDEAPFNSLDAICRWAASLGYKGVQIPTWDARLFDLRKAAESDAYCDEIAGHRARGTAWRSPSFPPICRASSSPCIRPIDDAFDGFAAPEVRGNPKARQEWAVEQMLMAAKASQRLGLNAQRDLLRRARLAVHLSLAAASGRSRRDRLRGAGPALEADPRRL